MKKTFIIILIILAALAVALAGIVWWQRSTEAGRRTQCFSGLRSLWVAVAAEDLSAGTVLAPHHIAGKGVPVEEAKDCFVMSQTNALLGRIIAKNVKAMQPITTEMISDTEPTD